MTELSKELLPPEKLPADDNRIYLLEAPKQETIPVTLPEKFWLGTSRLWTKYKNLLPMLFLLLTITGILYFFLYLLFGAFLPKEWLLIGLWLLACLVLKLDSRFTIGSGVLGVVSIPIVFIYRDSLVDRTATAAFFLLLFGILQQLLELLRERNNNDDEVF